jgi:pSer/pThr/pTyr-binding forkhead associated (FHA) protein
VFKLLIQDDEGHQTVVPLARQEITIGRQPGNAVRLTERNVSRRHARFLRHNGTVVIEDLKSANGTQVNGERLQGRVSLRAGDHVRIGDYDLSIRSQETASEGPVGNGVGVKSSATTVRLRPRKFIWRKWVAVALALVAVAAAVAADQMFINARPIAQHEVVNELPPVAAAPNQPEAPSEQTPAPELKAPAPAPTTSEERPPAVSAATESVAAETPTPPIRQGGEVRNGNLHEPKQTRTAAPSKGALRRNQQQVKRLYERGTDLLRKNELNQAVDALNKCLALDPGFAKCHRMLGATYARLKNPEQGAIHYRRFVQLAPDDPEAPKVRIFLEQYEATRGLSKKE